jgi:hypothetical protein
MSESPHADAARRRPVGSLESDLSAEKVPAPEPKMRRVEDPGAEPKELAPDQVKPCSEDARQLERVGTDNSDESEESRASAATESSGVSSWSETLTDEFFDGLVRIGERTQAYAQLLPGQKKAFAEYFRAHRAEIDDSLRQELGHLRRSLLAQSTGEEESAETIQKAIKAKLEKVAGEVAARPEVLAGSQSGDVRGSFEEFFQQYVREMFAKPWYQRATASQKAMLADKIDTMKPLVQEEIDKLLAAQGGKDYVITAADVQSVLATVTARLAQ